MIEKKGLARQRRELTKLWLTYRVPAALAVALIVAIYAATGAYERYSAEQASARQEQLGRSARALAAAAQRRLGALIGPLREASRGAAVRRALASRDPEALAAAAAELAAGRGDVLRVWLLPPGPREPDYQSSPPLGYAALLLAGEAEKRDRDPAPEVVLWGRPEAHLALAVRVAGDDGAPLGVVLWALEVAPVKGALEGADTGGGYGELIQPVPKGKPLVLARAGDPAARSGPATLRFPVRGTSWRVRYWGPPQEAEGGSDEIPEWVFGAAGVVVLLGLGGLVVWRRRRAQAEAPGASEPALEAPGPAPPPAPEVDSVEEPVAGDAPPAAAVEEEERAMDSAAAAEMPASIFRAYDIRGVVGKTLSPAIVRAIGEAIGSEALERGQQTLVVGYDGRASSPELAAALTEGLVASGRDVISVGQVPTPVLYFATHFFKTASGVMITGSHNPPDYNGLKVMLGGDTLFGEAIQALRARIERGDLARGQGSQQDMEIVDEYIRRISEEIPVALGNSFKVVIDCGNGVAGAVAPKLYRALGHDVVELYCEVDGRFPNHHPDPAVPENLADLIAAVREHGADLGLAFDGDGDRLGVVDPDGRIIWPDRQMMLYARDVLSRNPGAEIIFDVKCTSRLPKVIRKLGGRPVMCKTGHSFIKGRLKESGAPLAGEMSGHIFFKDRWYGFDDALYTGARLLEILTALKLKPAEVFARLPDGVSTPELRLDFRAEGAHQRFMERLLAGDHFSDGERTTIDGLRVDYPDGWGLVRASNTTPSLVLRFEADDAEGLERIKARFRETLLAVDPDLELPF